MQNELISVIVPVYNVENYLSRCVDSIINQTYSNLEIILVDDGSTDSSGIICDEYKKKDKRITVIHQENGGVSSARNRALDIIKGKYVVFSDSDDFVSKDYIMYLYKLLLKYKSDISICGLQSVGEKYAVQNKREKSIVRVYDSRTALEMLCYQKEIANAPWGKMYKASLFNDIRYPVGRAYSEDLITTYKLIDKSAKIVKGSKKIYFYYQRTDSVMHQSFSLKLMDKIEISEEVMKHIQEKYPELIKAAICRFFISNVQVLRVLPYKDKKYQHELKFIKENIRLYRKTVLCDSKAKKINRLVALASCLNVGVLQQLGRFYNYFE